MPGIGHPLKPRQSGGPRGSRHLPSPTPLRLPSKPLQAKAKRLLSIRASLARGLWTILAAYGPSCLPPRRRNPSGKCFGHRGNPARRQCSDPPRRRQARGHPGRPVRGRGRQGDRWLPRRRRWGPPRKALVDWFTTKFTCLHSKSALDNSHELDVGGGRGAPQHQAGPRRTRGAVWPVAPPGTRKYRSLRTHLLRTNCALTDLGTTNAPRQL